MKTYIRYPLNINLVFGMSILTLLCIFSIITTNDMTKKLFYLVFSIVYLLIITVAVIRRFLKPKLLRLEGKVLIIDDNRIEASDIERIFIDGNYIIGIKPKKNRIVPIALCFKFIHNHNEIKTLTDWAKSNNIKVSNKTFMRWI